MVARRRLGHVLWAVAALLVGWRGGECGTEPAPPPVFPQPAKMELLGPRLTLGKNARLVLPGGDERLAWVAEVLSAELGRALGAGGGRLAIVNEAPTDTPGAADVSLGTASAGRLAAQRAKALAGELAEKAGAYVLAVEPSGVAVLGRDAAGAFYGALTLLQLFTPPDQLTCAKIVDSPYHFYRGMRAGLPRGKPREGEVTHAYFRDLLRLMAFCRLNHVWVEGTSWNTPMRRHPEMAWQDVLTPDQAKALVGFATRQFLSMDGSLSWQWVYYDYKRLAELYPDETWDTMRGVRKKSRVNVCPSNPESWKLLFETMEDIVEVLPGDHFAVPLDEMYQEYNGSRWAVCKLCQGKDPVKLFAEFASRLTGRVLELGKVPIIGGGMLVREHQGWYKDIYKAIDLIERRDKLAVYNWSEGHIRRGAMKVKGETLHVPDFKATPFFRGHGYKDVMHLFAGNDHWAGRPEMREVRGKLDCYGGFVSYYHPMNYELMKQNGTLANLVFTAQHLWSPDSPPMDSEDDARACRYGEALADGVLQGKSYVEAIAGARRAWLAPPGSTVLTGGAVGRVFESKDPPINLMEKQRGDRTAGEMRIALPVEEANPAAAYLVLTLFDWDQRGEGEITLNSHKVDLATSKLSNGRDYEFPPVRVPAAWLKFGSEPNVLKFTWRSTAGFIARKARIILADAPGDERR
ncbi:MAG TPA: glycoside hydrolase family 20 zincin-like fold domain-containing protein [Planctomycetota bacterium]|nr:glycoside hydrolase family 20 zincin-like fold domain-containing protein [Planctomycetota bacterium]